MFRAVLTLSLMLTFSLPAFAQSTSRDRGKSRQGSKAPGKDTKPAKKEKKEKTEEGYVVTGDQFSESINVELKKQLAFGPPKEFKMVGASTRMPKTGGGYSGRLIVAPKMKLENGGFSAVFLVDGKRLTPTMITPERVEGERRRMQDGRVGNVLVDTGNYAISLSFAVLEQMEKAKTVDVQLSLNGRKSSFTMDDETRKAIQELITFSKAKVAGSDKKTNS